VGERVASKKKSESTTLPREEKTGSSLMAGRPGNPYKGKKSQDEERKGRKGCTCKEKTAAWKRLENVNLTKGKDRNGGPQRRRKMEVAAVREFRFF